MNEHMDEDRDPEGVRERKREGERLNFVPFFSPPSIGVRDNRIAMYRWEGGKRKVE